MPLMRCSNLTDIGLHHLLQGLPRLQMKKLAVGLDETNIQGDVAFQGIVLPEFVEDSTSHNYDHYYYWQ